MELTCSDMLWGRISLWWCLLLARRGERRTFSYWDGLSQPAQMMECHSRRLGTWVQNAIYIVFGPLKIQRRDVYFCIHGFLAGEGYFDLCPYRVAIALFGSGCSALGAKNFLSASTFRSNNRRLRHMSSIWKGGATEKLLLHCFAARKCAGCIYILCGRKSTRAKDK